MDIPLPVGRAPPQTGPLARFMPPVEQGAPRRALAILGEPNGILVDPFGASARTVIEAAQAGWTVVVAANNPVNRFLLQRTCRPFPLAELQAALARLAAAPKDQTRLEPFLLDLYRTECSRCGTSVSAEYFVWDRDAKLPVLRAYACRHCNHVAEEPTQDVDRERAHSQSRRGLQHALALEQVAPAGDPDRPYAEAALSVYPGRALYAMITLVNKLQQMNLEPSNAAPTHALMLSALDAANALWGHPEGRVRPRQMSLSLRYREVNVWRALERAVQEWALEDPHVQTTDWPTDLPLSAGTIAIFPGTARALGRTLPTGSAKSLFTVVPRPNQAYWTLAALWAAWLWGKEAAAPIKVALRRRRYDWSWHAAAVRATVAGLAPAIQPGAAALALLPEAEPGLLSAALAGMDGAGFRLEGLALRVDEASAFMAWRAQDAEVAVRTPAELEQRTALGVQSVLMARGEPSPFPVVHAAALRELAAARMLAPLWQTEEATPLPGLSDALERLLGNRTLFVHLGKGTEAESGLYWLASTLAAPPTLMDRLEIAVLSVLRAKVEIAEEELEALVGQEMPGLLTPDRRLMRVCLESYSIPDAERGKWSLRPEERSEARKKDLEEIRALLDELGKRLGYEVRPGPLLSWLDSNGHPLYAFHVQETAAMGAWLADSGSGRIVLVLPGGRASLVAEKARRDPRIRAWLAAGARLVKFRHIRRLAADGALQNENFEQRLALDPPEHEDPQMPLL